MTKQDRTKLLKNARKFQFSLESDSTDFQHLSAEIYSDLMANSCFPPRGGQLAQKHHLSLALLNLIYSDQTDAYPLVQYPLRQKYYKKSRYVPGITSFRSANYCVKGLEKLGYIKIYKGYTDRKRKYFLTRIRPLKKLRILFSKYSVEKIPIKNGQIETIILRDSNKDLVDYIDTPRTTKMRKNLSIINDQLNKILISLYIKDTEYEKLNKRLQIEKDKQPIDFSRKTLRRVFNNGSWNEGGRFYHAWWVNLPKEYRKYIRIDTKATVEVDFSGIHPSMLYAIHAPKPLGKIDPYIVDKSLGVSRDLGKVIFNTLINSEDRNSGFGAIRNKLNSSGLGSSTTNVNKVIDAFFDLHSDIKSAFFTGEGRRLQYNDSQLAEAVMLHFCKLGYVALPVHDSFIVHHGLESELIRVMKEAFKSLMGDPINTDKTKVFYFKKPPKSVINEKLSKGLDPYLAPKDIDFLFNDYGYGKYNEMTRRHFDGMEQQHPVPDSEKSTGKQKHS